MILSQAGQEKSAGLFSVPAHEDAYADAGDVEIELERAELADLLDRALALLPPVTRAVLIERYIRDAPSPRLSRVWASRKVRWPNGWSAGR